jgi:hypothetical protein
MSSDVERATLVVRVHCSIDWPDGPRCNNCHLPHPCPRHRDAVHVLAANGWSQAKIAALDARRGAWA